MILDKNIELANKKYNCKKYVFAIAIIILIGVSFATGWNLHSQQTEKLARDGQVLNMDSRPEYLSEDIDFDLFWDTWSSIKSKYFKKDITDIELFYGAMDGLVQSLEDPYSVFMNPEESKAFDEEIRGEFEGIGAEIGIRNNRLTIIAPLPDTPADKAGVRSGDKIYLIDDYDTTNISLDKAVHLIRGQKGTDVILMVMREEEDAPLEIKITRGRINVVSVRYEIKKLDNKNVGYISISHFSDDTQVEFDKAIRKIFRQDVNGVILDLRNNPGGYLSMAVEVAGYWVDGKLVVREKFSDGAIQDYYGQGQAELDGIKTIVLVNEGSASASEIVAGALQDYQLATILGEQTFGKGSVQELEKLEDGSAVKLTVAEWLTPNENSINDVGITPDIEVEMTYEDYNEERDPQLEKALEFFK